MAKTSAGLLVYRVKDDEVQVLLVHPGGPFFTKKDAGAWTIPKGEFTDGEEALDAARREFTEETGTIVDGVFHMLAPVKLKSGKIVYAWAIHSEPDMALFKSNTFSIEWPPGSGKIQEFPEVDKAEWFTLIEAKNKINSAQAAFIDELRQMLDNNSI